MKRSTAIFFMRHVGDALQGLGALAGDEPLIGFDGDEIPVKELCAGLWGVVDHIENDTTYSTNWDPE